MYFSEQGNVDDDATLITISLVFNLQSCCLMQSAVCSLQSANVIHRLQTHKKTVRVFQVEDLRIDHR